VAEEFREGGNMAKQNGILPKFLKGRSDACYASAQVEQDKGNVEAMKAWLLAAVAYGDAHLELMENGDNQEVKELTERGFQHSDYAAKMYQ
jgi:hypothetical protein